MRSGPSVRFVDQAAITVQAGRGGNGCRSFYKDLWSRYPTPDGGDGGRGGHVRIRCNPQLTTLLDFQTRRHFVGGPGGHGSSKGQRGAQGADSVVELPPGTVVRDADTRERIHEMLEPGEEIVVAQGGEGGTGNANKERSRRPGTPRFDLERLQGEPGEKRHLQMELKLVADVGIVGMPNAGKSTLISQISQARPRVASFPFTTLHPVLGAVTLPQGRSFVAVDVPGLIEGAHQGRGLGLDFLRHIERTRLLIHLVDMAGLDGRDPLEDYRALMQELRSYRVDLSQKRQILVANKMDRSEAKGHLDRFRKAVKLRPVLISAESGEGVPELLKKVWTELERLKGEND